ncbi:MAG: histidine kinase N-terminal 7TM domain-containing protein [Candidatus Thermoplasmatota archaeon]|nr:histidine kinase N-terminal 7TM domain-containing protein [Candidatus Thermoplasmatota archaeon]
MVQVMTVYLYLLLLSAKFVFILAFYSWQTFVIQQKMTAAKYLTLLLTCIGIWSLSSGLALWNSSENLTYFFEQWKYVGIVFIPSTWLLLVSSWSGQDKWIHWRIILILNIVPLISLAIIFTDPIHHLFWQEITYIPVGSFLDDAVVHGPAWWLMWGYLYILLIFGTVLLVKSTITLHSFYKKQVVLLLLAAIIPWIANIFYSLQFFTPLVGHMDLTPISFSITGLLLIYGFTHFNIISVIPISKETVFDNIQDPVVVFDANKRIIELNKSAIDNFQLNSDQVIGKKDSDIFSSYPEIIHSFDLGDNHHSFEVKIDNSISFRYFDVTFSKVNEKNQPLGYVLSFRDITQRKSMTDALKESENKFRTFTESASIAIMIHQDDTWIYANPHAEKVTGYTQSELRAMKYWDFVHPDYLDSVIQCGLACQRGENPIEKCELKIITKQCIEKWVELKSKKILFCGKSAVLITASDITERKKSVQTIKKQLTAIKNSMDGIAILNQKGEYLYLNDAHASIYGYDSTEELIGKTWRILYNERELNRFDTEIMPVFQQKGYWRGEAVGIKKDNTPFDQEITLTAIEDGIICVVRDITKEKMMVRELTDAHELLHAINKDLTRKVKQRTQEIERLVKQKDDFINQLGHDLKTPLTPLMVLLPILKKNVQTEKDEELFQVVIRNIHFMKDLVNNTIELARLNTDKIEFSTESLPLLEEVDLVLKNNQILFQEHGIEVSSTIDPSLQIYGDKLLLQEVFNNLLTNAIKFTPEDGGHITISAEDTSVDEITVAVADNGIGMNEDQRSQIFDEFYKADESRHDIDSSGLGLPICKRIIEKHGGRIWAESEGIGKGSTFYFTLKKSKVKEMVKELS